jgi:hypothetical protein
VDDRIVSNRGPSLSNVQVVSNLQWFNPLQSAPNPTIEVKIQGSLKLLIVDTGASLSLLQPGTNHFPLSSTTAKHYSIYGDLLNILGSQKIIFFCSQ